MTTLRDLLTSAIPRLAAAGIDSPKLDAELLLAHVLGRERVWLWTHLDAPVPAEEAAAFAALLARRLQREPLAYLLGTWEFYGRPFTVSPAVLVPRPETENLVEAVLRWAREHGARRIADIGTGSGAIAVTLAAELPTLEVVAVDLSPEALEIARGNAARHGVAPRITFLHGDLLAPLQEAALAPVDALVANLPYIAEEERPELMPEVRDYEPSMALFAPERGLALIRRLIAQAPQVLAPGGLLALEVGDGQAEEVAAILRDAGWQGVRTIEDYGGIARDVLANRG